MKKNFLYTSLFILLIGIVWILHLPRWGCFSFDMSCNYDKLMQVSYKTIYLGSDEFNVEIRNKYGFMKGYLFQKLKKDINTPEHKLFIYNAILNPDESKQFSETCLNSANNSNVISECLWLYAETEQNKNLILQKLKKYEKDDSSSIKTVYEEIMAKIKK